MRKSYQLNQEKTKQNNAPTHKHKDTHKHRNTHKHKDTHKDTFMHSYKTNDNGSMIQYLHHEQFFQVQDS